MNFVRQIMTIGVIAVFLWLYTTKPQTVIVQQAQPPQFGRDPGYTVLVIVGVAFAVLVCGATVAALLWLAAWVRNKWQFIYAQNGVFPVVKLNGATIGQRLRGERHTTFVPVEMLAQEAATVIVHRNGQTEVSGGRADWTAEHQLQMAMAVQRTRLTAATMNSGPMRYAAQAKLAAGAYDRAARVTPRSVGEPQAAPAVPQLTVNPLDLRALLAASEAENVAFGQEPESGDLALWHVPSTPHIRLHGSTQTGKTSAALTIVAALLTRSWQVVVLDPRGFKDWHLAEQHVELVDVRRPEAFADALAALHAEYERRDALLAANGARSIAHLRAGLRPPRLAVVMDEYGAQRVRATAAGTLEQIDHHLSVLSAEAGADGIHLIAIDQRPTNYHPTVKANLGGVIVFPLPDGAGRAAGYPLAHRLPRYHFWYDGQVYRSVHAAPDFCAALRNATVHYPPIVAHRMTHADIANWQDSDTGSCAMTVDGEATVSTGYVRSPNGVHDSSGQVRPEALCVTQNGEPWPTNDVYRPTPDKWEAFTLHWFAVNSADVTARMINLARAMAAAEGNVKPYTHYKSIAHRMYHRHKPSASAAADDADGEDAGGDDAGGDDADGEDADGESGNAADLQPERENGAPLNGVPQSDGCRATSNDSGELR